MSEFALALAILALLVALGTLAGHFVDLRVVARRFTSPKPAPQWAVERASEIAFKLQRIADLLARQEFPPPPKPPYLVPAVMIRWPDGHRQLMRYPGHDRPAPLQWVMNVGAEQFACSIPRDGASVNITPGGHTVAPFTYPLHRDGREWTAIPDTFGALGYKFEIRLIEG